MMKKTLLAIAAFLFCVQAYAYPSGCPNKSVLNGDFIMYQNAVNTNQHTGRCEVHILNGVVNSQCAFSSGFVGPVNGTATLNKNCSGTMALSFSPASGVIVDSSFDIQLNADKLSFAGQWSNSFGVVGTTTGVRYNALLPNTSAP